MSLTLFLFGNGWCEEKGRDGEIGFLKFLGLENWLRLEKELGLKVLGKGKGKGRG